MGKFAISVASGWEANSFRGGGLVSTLKLDAEHKQVLRHLRLHGPTARTNLAQQININNNKITEISHSLLDLGFIEEVISKDGRGRGRPAVPLRLSMRGGYSFGATIHKGVLEMALLSYNGDVIDIESHNFLDSEPDVFVEFVGRRINELAGKHRLLASRLLGLGISVPGPAMSAERDRWWTVDELAGWRDIPLRDYMGDALGIPVWIENDANASAIAEFYLGGLIGCCRTAIVILLGYGIGAGIIVEGNILQGEAGQIGEIGAIYPKYPRPSTLDLFKTLSAEGFEIHSVADLERACAEHMAVLDMWICRAALQLEPIIKSGFAWLDPGAIVISSPLPAQILDQLSDKLNGAGLFELPSWATPPRVTVSKLGRSAPSLGAAMLPIHAVAQL